ncbi:MAG: sugar O-acetyltransferase, partial [Lachnospiraceae bacterium]|nr:sugar O-acetyltransferase [Lachnospiraceae bacterium]
MNELEKCMAGEYYDCHDPVFLGFKGHARKLLKEYNALAYEQKEEKYNILKQLFGGIGANVTVGSPFICD